MTFNCNCPASAASVTVKSLPITLYAIWLTTSGITGLIFAGIMDEPACNSGKRISAKPVRGPELNRRKSLQIFESLTARRFSVLDKIINTPQSLVAST